MTVIHVFKRLKIKVNMYETLCHKRTNPSLAQGLVCALNSNGYFSYFSNWDSVAKRLGYCSLENLYLSDKIPALKTGRRMTQHTSFLPTKGSIMVSSYKGISDGELSKLRRKPQPEACCWCCTIVVGRGRRWATRSPEHARHPELLGNTALFWAVLQKGAPQEANIGSQQPWLSIGPRSERRSFKFTVHLKETGA